MTIHEIITGFELESIDAEMLIGFVLGKPRSWVIAHDDKQLDVHHQRLIESILKRRRAVEPTAYITGAKEFYGRAFTVSPNVLIPRPATENLVSLALAFLDGKTPETQEIDSGISAFIKRLNTGEIEIVIDIGTGSGCIALTLALEGVKQRIIGVDSSETALAIAKLNQENLGAKNVEFVHADGPSFVHAFRKPFLLVSNPPYIPLGTRLAASVLDFEPHRALFAGEDGMDVLRPLMRAAGENPACIGMVIEMRTDQTSMSGER